MNYYSHLRNYFIHLCRLLFTAIFALFLSDLAPAETIKHDNKEYTVTRWNSLAESGFRMFLSDLPSVYNGTRVVTVGLLRYTCDFDTYVDKIGRTNFSHTLAPVTEDRKWDVVNPRLYWGELPQARISIFQNECKALSKKIALDSTLPMPVAVVYGTVHNGTGASPADCNSKTTSLIYEPAKKCLHVVVEDIVFGDAIRTNNELLAESAVNIAKTYGPDLLGLIFRSYIRK